ELTRGYQFIDRKSGAVLRIRTFYGDTSEYRLTKLKFTPATIDVFPNGISSTAVTIDLENGDYNKQITASTAGFVRVKPKLWESHCVASIAPPRRAPSIANPERVSSSSK